MAEPTREALPEPLKVVAYRVDWPAEIGIAPDRFYGADDTYRMNCHTSYVQGVGPVPIPLVRLTDALLALESERQAHAAEIAGLRDMLADASKLLKRSPPAAMGMYIGRDRKSFGAQAKGLVAAIDQAIAKDKP